MATPDSCHELRITDLRNPALTDALGEMTAVIERYR